MVINLLWLLFNAVHSDCFLRSNIVFTVYQGISDTKLSVPLYILFNNNKNTVYSQVDILAIYVPNKDEV